MQDSKSEEYAAQVRSIQKICNAYRFIFSEIGPNYHRADFELNRKNLITELLKELPLSISLREELISAIEVGWKLKSTSRELLGEDYAAMANIINNFLKDLEAEIRFAKNLHQSIFDYSLDMIFKWNQLFEKDQRMDLIEVLQDIRPRVEKFLLNGTDLAPKTKNDFPSQRMNHRISHKNPKIKITKEKLIAALDEGKTYRDCAEMFGCNYRTIAYYFKKFGLSKSGKPALSKETLEYHLMKMTPAECAKELGYDKQTIYKCMKKFGLKSCLRRSSEDLEQEILMAIKNSPSISSDELVDLCKAEKRTISKYLNKLINRNLVQYGYTATSDLEDTLIHKAIDNYNLIIYTFIKNNPGIASDDIIVRLNKKKDFVLKSLSKLVSAKLVKFGYVSATETSLSTYISNLELDQERQSLEEDYKVSQFIIQNDRNWIKEGDDLYYRKNFKESISCYDRAIEWDPVAADVYYKKGKSLSALSAYEDSIKCYDTALKLNPIFLDALFDKGLALLNLGRNADCALCCDQIIRINPEYAPAWYFKGFVASISNQYEIALYSYENAIRIDPSMALAWLGRGNIFYKMANYNDAIKSYDMAIEEDPLYANAWYNKGLVLKKLGYYNEALKAYNKAININKFNFKYWNNKGVVLKNLKRYDEALECYDKAIELGVVDINLLNNTGNALYGLTRYEDAIGCYNSAIDIDSRNVIAFYNKGLSMSKLNRIEIAVELYEKIITIDPEFIKAWINKGFAHKNLSNYKYAIECFDRAICLEPSAASLWCAKGTIFNDMGNYMEANRCYSRAIELNPKLAEAWNGNGLSLSGLGRYTDARNAFSRAKTLGFS